MLQQYVCTVHMALVSRTVESCPSLQYVRAALGYACSNLAQASSAVRQAALLFCVPDPSQQLLSRHYPTADRQVRSPCCP